MRTIPFRLFQFPRFFDLGFALRLTRMFPYTFTGIFVEEVRNATMVFFTNSYFPAFWDIEHCSSYYRDEVTLLLQINTKIMCKHLRGQIEFVLGGIAHDSIIGPDKILSYLLTV